jgi:hypothetical protein
VTEIFEYLIVVAVSSVLAGSSLMVLHGSLPTIGAVGVDAEFNQVVGATNLAIIRGAAVTAVIPLENGYLSCARSQLSFGSNGESFSSEVGFDCSFRFQDLSCLCTLIFEPVGSTLRLEVIK